MTAHRVDAQADNLRIALGEFGLQARHIAKFGGAHRREVFGMGKQNRPSVADPFVKVDRTLRGFGREIRGSVVDAGNSRGLGCSLGTHIFLLVNFGFLKLPANILVSSTAMKYRMKTKPTRFAGWVGEMSLASLPTRRRTHATTCRAGVGRAKHVVRIEVRTQRCQPRERRVYSSFLEFSCIAKRRRHLFACAP